MDSKKIAINAACAGAVGAIATKILLGADGQLNFFGVPLPAYVATGVGCAGGSVVSDVASEMIVKKMGVSNQIMNGSTLAIQVGVSGSACSAILWAGGMPIANAPIGFAIGAGSKLGGDYANSKLFDSRTGILPF